MESAASKRAGEMSEVFTPIALAMLVLIKELLLREVSFYWLTVGRVDGGLAFGIKVRIAFHVTITNP